MNGKTYSGVLYLPDHPCADLHGLVRACIRERNWLAVSQKLIYRYEINVTGGWNTKIWQESKSRIEQTVTERHYGELLVCRLDQQYLSYEHYHLAPVPRKRKTG